MSGSSPTDAELMSAECAVAHRSEYKDLHEKCGRTEDFLLPHGGGIVLVARCRCACHQQAGDGS